MKLRVYEVTLREHATPTSIVSSAAVRTVSHAQPVELKVVSSWHSPRYHVEDSRRRLRRLRRRRRRHVA